MRADLRVEGVNLFANQKVHANIKGEGEEERLQIKSRAITRNGLDQLMDVTFKHGEIVNFGASKAWPDHLPRVFPDLAIGRKDAFTYERREK